jgi:hypothetical protein
VFLRRQSCQPARALAAPGEATLVLSQTVLVLNGYAGDDATDSAFIQTSSSAGGPLTNPSASTVTYTDGSGWLSIAKNGNLFTVTADPVSLTQGQYAASFTIMDQNATAESSPQTVSVTFVVDAAVLAVLQADDRFLTPSAETDGDPPDPLVMIISNVGTGMLAGPTASTVNYPSGQAGWVTGVAIASLGNDQYSCTITMDQTGLAEGDHRAVFVVSDANSAAIIETIVDLEVFTPIPATVLAVTPSSLTFNATEGDTVDPPTQTFTITNSGGGTLAGPTAQMLTAASWCSSVISGSGNNWSLDVSVEVGSLADGTYQVTFRFDDANATNGPLDRTVTFTVADAGGVAQPAYGSALLPRNPAGVSMEWDGDLRQYTGYPISFDFSAVPTFSGTVHQVATATQFGTAMAAAVDGDVIELTASFNASTSLVCRNRGTSGWVWIRSSGYASLPTYSGNVYTSTAASNRVDTTAHAAHIRTVTSTGNNIAPFRFAQGASGYWFTGIGATIASNRSINGALFEIISNSTQTTQAHQPSRIVLDRCWIRGPQARRGVNVSGRDMLISGSVVDNIDDISTNDSQAIGNINGGQHLLVFNNKIEGVSEPIFSGSGSIGITNQDPSDMAFIRNLVTKRAAWDSDVTYPEKKNMFEMKHGVRVLYFGQIHDNYQSSTGGQFQEIALTPSASYSWGKVHDVTIHGVYSKGGDGGWLQMSPQGSNGAEVHQGGARVTVAHCFQESGGTHAQSRIVFSCGANAGNQRDWPDVTIEHNSLRLHNAFLILDSTLVNTGAQWLRFRFANNVNTKTIENGPVFASAGVNANALNLALGTGNWTFTKNGIVSGASSFATGSSLLVSPHLCFQDSAANIFTDPVGGDYTILSSSSYNNSGTDGLDPGADIDWVVNTLTAGVEP